MERRKSDSEKWLSAVQLHERRLLILLSKYFILL